MCHIAQEFSFHFAHMDSGRSSHARRVVQVPSLGCWNHHVKHNRLVGMPLRLVLLFMVPAAHAAEITLIGQEGGSWGLKRARGYENDGAPLTLSGVSYGECFHGDKDTNELFVSAAYKTASARLMCSEEDGLSKVQVQGYSDASCEKEIPITIVQLEPSESMKSNHFIRFQHSFPEWATITVNEAAVKAYHMTPEGGSNGRKKAAAMARAAKFKMERKTNFKLSTDCSQATLDLEVTAGARREMARALERMKTFLYETGQPRQRDLLVL